MSRALFTFLNLWLSSIGLIHMQENPAIVQSYYDRRIVGCPGGEGGRYRIWFIILIKILSPFLVHRTYLDSWHVLKS